MQRVSFRLQGLAQLEDIAALFAGGGGGCLEVSNSIRSVVFAPPFIVRAIRCQAEGWPGRFTWSFLDSLKRRHRWVLDLFPRIPDMLTIAS